LVLVTNGTYATGGRAVYGSMTNRVAVDKPLNLRSVNGPLFTFIQGNRAPGDGAIRCVYLTNDASLSGFTLTNGATRVVNDWPIFRENSGGGLWCETINTVVSNCVLAGNSAYFYGGGAYGGTLNNCTLSGNVVSAESGGGAAYSTLNNCTLSGNSASPEGGGASDCTLNNCTLTGNSSSYGGGAIDCTLNNCALSGNSAGNGTGGGAYISTLNNCTLASNTAVHGGGADSSTLNDCTLTGNSAGNGNGGGASYCTLNNCTLTGNTALYGGRADGGALTNCRLSGNSVSNGIGGGTRNATIYRCTLTGNSGIGAVGGSLNGCTLTANSGAGASGCTLFNCALTGNLGPGADNSTLNNCTLTGNSGGGAQSSTLNNCILYFNRGTNYDSSSTLNYCCTTPLPASGADNISSDPQLATFSHLSAASPCRGAGNSAYASGTDIDGEAWLSPPSIGCDEFITGAVTGPLSVGMAASFTNVLMGFTVQLTALVEGRITASSWDFGDGITVSNQPYTSHAWTALGDYAVVLRAYNESWPDGISATVIVHVVDGIHYVAANSTNPMAPYASWATAATNIQDAINVVEAGGPLVVVVTNGIYAPIATSGPLAVRSVNGPLFTIIDGNYSKQCVTLSTNASLSGFTLTNGASGASGGTLNNCILTGNSGGAAHGCTLNNCTLSGNSAVGSGGGASGCTLNNCVIRDNRVTGSYYYSRGGEWIYHEGYGGGAYSSTLNNCTLTGNSSGAYGCALNNCILYFNSGGNYDSSSTLNYCCTTPQQTNGVGNISSDPQLASFSHLSAGSPCRGAGNAVYASGVDIDGEHWLSPPSMGCDEYHAGSVAGPLSVGIDASYTNVTVGLTVQFTALIDGPTTASY